MEPIELPSFETVECALSCLRAFGTAAETHGLLCALVSTGATIRKQAWVNSLLSNVIETNDMMAQDAVASIDRLFNATQKQFKEDQCQVQLLMPDDNVELKERMQALAEWCQGYMSGLKLVGVTLQDHNDEKVQEALDDITQISCLDYDNDSAEGPEAQAQLTELQEFVRMAVMLVYDDFLTQQSKQPQHITHVH